VGTTASTVRQTVLDMAAPLLRDRVIVCTGAAAHARRMAEFFTAAGAGRVASVEISTVPAETRRRFAAYEAALSAPDHALQRELDVIDPGRHALIYAGSYTAVREVCGRTTIGARTPAHQAVERKDAQPAFTRARTRQITIGPELLDARRPTVVQGVPDAGIAMATSHTYLIPSQPSAGQLAALVTHLRRDCTTALLSRPDPGRPCTFYGFVAPDWVIDFGPVEAFVFWHRRTWRIHAPGIARPMSLDPDALNAARATTHAVARRLHQQTGYVGAFGADGVLHGSRYLVHEINPRVCAGFTLLDQLQPDAAPLAAVDLVLRELGAAAAAVVVRQLGDTAQALRDDERFEFRLWDHDTHRQVVDRVHQPGAGQAPGDIVRRTLTQDNLVPLCDLSNGDA
jgi:hypothetical protein